MGTGGIAPFQRFSLAPACHCLQATLLALDCRLLRTFFLKAEPSILSLTMMDALSLGRVLFMARPCKPRPVHLRGFVVGVPGL